MLQIVILIIVFFLSVEAMFWAFSINRHAHWLRQHPDYDRRLAVTSSILGLAGYFTAILSLSLWIWQVYSFALCKMCVILPMDYYLKSAIICWMQLSLIHLWAIVARYSCLHTQYWPIASGLISRLLIHRLKLTDLSVYCNSMRKWSDLDRLSERHKLLIFKFADEMKDLVWTKDELKRYTYVNKVMGDKFLLMDSLEAVGLTHQQIADALRDQGISYNFDLVSVKSDDEVLRTKKVIRFIDRGTVADKEIILHVLKSPIFLNGQVIGIIGAGRDISFEVSAIEKIELLFKAGEVGEGVRLFYLYKDKFMNLEHYNN